MSELHGPLTLEQQAAYDACERSLTRGEQLVQQSQKSEIHARVFVDSLERQQSGHFSADESTLNRVRSELISMGSTEVATIVNDSRRLAEEVSFHDPLGKSIVKIKHDLAREPFQHGVRENISTNVRSFVEEALRFKPETEEDPVEEREEEKEQPPAGLDPNNSKSKIEAWQRGTQNFMNEYNQFLEECNLDEFILSPENKKYYNVLLENIQSIAGMGTETPYPFYYLEVARGFFQFVKFLAEAQFDFSQDYKNLKRYSLSFKGRKGKAMPLRAHNYFAKMSLYLDSDDATLLYAKLFENVPLLHQSLLILGKNVKESEFDGYIDANSWMIDDYQPRNRAVFFILQTDEEEERKKGLPPRKELKKQWPHLQWRLL